MMFEINQIMGFHKFMDYGKINLDMEIQKIKKKAKGFLLGKNSPFNNIPILGAIL